MSTRTSEDPNRFAIVDKFLPVLAGPNWINQPSYFQFTESFGDVEILIFRIVPPRVLQGYKWLPAGTRRSPLHTSGECLDLHGPLFGRQKWERHPLP